MDPSKPTIAPASPAPTSPGTVLFPESMSREEALIELWSCTKALGLGAIHSHKTPSLDDAKKKLEHATHVDYFFGKPIKTDFKSYPSLSSVSYDCDAGEGTMERVARGTAVAHGATKKLSPSEVAELVESSSKQISVFALRRDD